MARNANLNKAKAAKNDEFYTRLADVSNELMYYKQHLKGKTVLCNCDDPAWSAFWKYFHLNFSALGLKKLISTHYDKNEPTYKMEYTGGDDDDTEVGVKTPLEGNGDFRNQECLDILDEADIVVTNPPFSLFREYVAILMEHEKKFLIIGSINAVTCKKIFPLIREGKICVNGGTSKGNSMYFTVPDDFAGKTVFVDGVPVAHIPAWWFTNLDSAKQHQKYIFRKNYTPEEYPKYDNRDAINVGKVSEIPRDYYGVMGVPITFLDNFNPDQFEIVAFRKGDDGKDLVFTREREREFNRTFVSLYDLDCRDDKKRIRQNQWEAYLCRNNNQTEIEPIDFFFPNAAYGAAGLMTGLIGGKETYKRILIRKKVGA